MGPKYYCATCDLPQKDLTKGCPTCPLTQLFTNAYKRAAVEEINYRGGMPEGFTIEGLMVTHAKVARILGDNKEKINPAWPVEFTELVEIILEERRQQKFIEDWNHWKKITAT